MFSTRTDAAGPIPERIAVVTGSARGIGLATAAALRLSGHRVIGVDLRDQPPGSVSEAVRLDLADAPAVEAFCAAVGRVDVLVNNAALLIEKPFEEITHEDFERMVAVNQRAVFLLCRGLAGGMRERGWGRIVNVSSVGARTGGISQSAVYAMTKAALIALTKNLARNLGPHAITANAIAPGAIDTPMARGQDVTDPGFWERTRAQIPLRRYADPEEVASLIDFLASDRAAFITGATIDINGGWFMY